MVSLGIFGIHGRMGRSIVQAADELGVVIAGGAGSSDAPAPVAASADVLIDFSAAAALEANLSAARAARTPIVVGTTGLTASHHALIDAAATEIAVLQTGNTSLGIALLQRLVREAARALGNDWDIEVLEMHHRNKVDAPSGTALMLGQAAADGRGADFAQAKVTDRNGKRAEGAIGFASLRGGSVIGEHQLVFAGPHERIVLGHHAEDRALFATGAIRAALWLAEQPAGRYGMAEVLGL